MVSFRNFSEIACPSYHIYELLCKIYYMTKASDFKHLSTTILQEHQTKSFTASMIQKFARNGSMKIAIKSSNFMQLSSRWLWSALGVSIHISWLQSDPFSLITRKIHGKKKFVAWQNICFDHWPWIAFEACPFL